MGESLVVVLPGGNPTAIAGEWAYEAGPEVFARLMQDTRSEQAGSVRIREEKVYLRMMGWELSLNGLVSAAISSQVLSGERVKYCRLVCDLGDDFVDATAQLTWKGRDSAIVRLRIRKFWSTVVACERHEASWIVCMKGITHLLVSNFASLQGHHSLAQTLIEADDSLGPAETVLFHGDLSSEFVDLEPYVYVRDVGSFVRETSCGSGAVALGMVGHLSRSLDCIYVRQPSGEIVKVEVANWARDDTSWSVSYETSVQVILAPDSRDQPVQAE